MIKLDALFGNYSKTACDHKAETLGNLYHPLQ